MQKFIDFSKKYCLLDLLFIFLVALFMFFLFYGKQDAYLIDVGREAYIPWQMLKGELLYKDIFNVYGPLGYQMNAILFAIFGVHLNTLYWAGFVNSLIILFSTFYISKLFVKKSITMTIMGVVIFVCAFSENFFNFVFSYSYCALYALSSALLSIYCVLKFIKQNNNKDLVLAFLFAGFSFANKIEYLPYFCLLFACLPFWFKTDWKKYLYPVGAFFVFPAISFGILLLQGVTFNDFFNAFVLVKKLMQSSTASYFYQNYGVYFDVGTIKYAFINVLLQGAFLLFIPVLCIFFMAYIKVNFIKISVFKHFFNIIIFCIIFFFLIKNYKFMHASYFSMYWWLGFACLFILCFWVVKIVKILLKRESFSQITVNDKMLLFLLISAITLSFKGFFSMNLLCYGTYTVAVTIIPFVIFVTNYLACLLPKSSQKAFKHTVVALLIMSMLTALMHNVARIRNESNYIVSTDKGMITIRGVYPAQNEMLKYIKENTPENSRIITMPEGAIINFLTQRDSDSKYYYLMPVNVEIFGEDNILKDFEKNPPDYFLLNDFTYTVYNTGALCNFAPKTCDFIDKNYASELKISGPISFILYKKK